MARHGPTHGIRCDWTLWTGISCHHSAKYKATSPYGKVVRHVCGKHRSSAVKYGDYDITALDEGASS